MYKLLRNILFLFEAEKVHYFSMNSLKMICKVPIFNSLVKFIYCSRGNHAIEAFGLQFQNSVGLAAGFDKNAKYLHELKSLGFGFVEIGTVTPLPQMGNSKPRLFRLTKDRALLNRMGFNNDGVEVVSQRLQSWRKSQKKGTDKFIIGGNIGKNKVTENENAWMDYLICFKQLYSIVDYFAINISSPNTPGLRDLQNKESLKKILTPLVNYKKEQDEKRPILLKIAPDLSQEELDEIIDVTVEFELNGLIISNTTIRREGLITGRDKIENLGSGGISGNPLKKGSNEMIRYVSKKVNGKFDIMGSGGIFNSDDANEKINCGAKLVQVWTGFIYEGPMIVKNIINNSKTK